MAGLLQVRDALALYGSVEARQLSEKLAAPLPLVQAMLDQLTLLGKAERITQSPDSCLAGSCRGCPEGQACKTVIYRPLT
ncbi:FeoC-like transcriptional regulator [Gibbsiella greigii]